jgi:hypothetical protein
MHSAHKRPGSGYGSKKAKDSLLDRYLNKYGGDLKAIEQSKRQILDTDYCKISENNTGSNLANSSLVTLPLNSSYSEEISLIEKKFDIMITTHDGPGDTPDYGPTNVRQNFGKKVQNKGPDPTKDTGGVQSKHK